MKTTKKDLELALAIAAVWLVHSERGERFREHGAAMLAGRPIDKPYGPLQEQEYITPSGSDLVLGRALVHV